MEKLANLSTSQLAELLAKATTRYYTLVGDRINSKEVKECKMFIKEIQKQIGYQKKLKQ
jgi:hypothetical protein